mgnify:CR=1 FL=1
MSMLAQTDALFLDRAGLDLAALQRQVDDALAGTDDGELFLEYRQSESLAFDDGRLKSAAFDTSQGFGLRAVAGESVGYAHSTELSLAAVARAAATVRAVKAGHSGTRAEPPAGRDARLYTDANPLGLMSFEDKVRLLAEIDAYARAKDPRVRQVMASLSGEWQAVQILRAGGQRMADIRPLVRMNVSVVVGEGDRQESGSFGTGGRFAFDRVVTADSWRAAVDEALRQALVNLRSVPAPAGEMQVVLGPGWPGILLHEAIADRRGSLTIDDEGTATRRTVLIEDGRLTGYMQDRQNARLMGMAPTGNGRRQSFAHHPMPRMTNTVMLGGGHTHDEILGRVKRGLYAVNFGGGQVDITSGKFVFSASEAYLVEDGRIGPPVKGAMLIGNGPDALTRVEMIGNDSALDPGVGTCGKDGQGVPVGVGQPTLLIDRLTVGGTGG